MNKPAIQTFIRYMLRIYHIYQKSDRQQPHSASFLFKNQDSAINVQRVVWDVRKRPAIDDKRQQEFPMKKILFAVSAVAMALSAGSAMAADLPSYKAPPPVYIPPSPMWTGFYAGLNAGYGWGTTSNATTAGLPVFDNAVSWDDDNSGSSAGLGLANSGVANVNQSGFVGGGQIGYNYQFNQNFVAGIETDMQGSAIRGQGSSQGVGLDNTIYNGAPYLQRTTLGGTEVSAGVDWFGTLRGRLGYLVTPTALVYATGGLIYGGVHAHTNSAFTNSYGYVYSGAAFDGFSNSSGGISGDSSSTKAGWNIGGGVEWMFLPNWSVKAEAFYYDLGSLTVNSFAIAGDNNTSPITAVAIATRVKYDGVIARAGVNYHFNWGAPAPVVAKY
jgi:outer membrane immunogenic protein